MIWSVRLHVQPLSSLFTWRRGFMVLIFKNSLTRIQSTRKILLLPLLFSTFNQNRLLCTRTLKKQQDTAAKQRQRYWVIINYCVMNYPLIWRAADDHFRWRFFYFPVLSHHQKKKKKKSQSEYETLWNVPLWQTRDFIFI